MRGVWFGLVFVLAPSDVEQCDDPAMLRSHEAGEFLVLSGAEVSPPTNEKSERHVFHLGNHYMLLP